MISWERRAYSQENFIEAWTNSGSIAECARKLNLVIYGSTYKTLRYTAKELDLNEEHMHGQGWRKGKTFTVTNARPLEEYLKIGSTIASSKLKAKLFRAGLKQNKCEECGLDQWNNKSLGCELEHINGDNMDNRIENIKILCPNCHSQTPTYCRRKSTGQTKAIVHLCVICNDPCNFSVYWHGKCNTCIQCGKKCQGLRCASCNGRHQTRLFKRNNKIDWPTREEVLDMLAQNNYTQVGKQLGVTDNAVRKFLKRSG